MSIQTYWPFQILGFAPGPAIHRIDDSLWCQCIEDLVSDRQVPIQETFLLDSEYFRMAGDLRQSVIMAASACEHVKELVFESKWMSANPAKEYLRDRELRGYHLPNHLRNQFRKLIDRSYHDEHPKEFDILKQLWDVRNNVAHGQKLEFGSPPTPVSFEQAQAFVDTARHVITWLLAL